MPTSYPDIWQALARPFHSHEVKVRQQAGRQLHYITARTAMNRLDDVLGPENWWDEYVPSEHSVLCKLTIRLPDGSTLKKEDAGGYAGMSDQGDDDKSGYSDAFKRTAVKFGVARYLYRDGVPDFSTQPPEEDGPAPAPAPAARPTPPKSPPSSSKKASKPAEKPTATATADKPLNFKSMLNQAMDARLVDRERKPTLADEIVRHLYAWGTTHNLIAPTGEKTGMKEAWAEAEALYRKRRNEAASEAMQYVQGRRPSQETLDDYFFEDRA